MPKKLILFFVLVTSISIAQNNYITGDSLDIVVSPKGGVCLMGGATENDSATAWFLKQANGGDVVVLRATGADGYNNYFYNFSNAPVNSVQTLVVNSTSMANWPYVEAKIKQAEAIFIAGGDQFNYINFWKNTLLHAAINYAVNVRKAVIGGTSAGMAVQGESYFSAQNGTITSSQALANPYHPNVTIGTGDFIQNPLLQNIITDTHFDNPDRKGRISVFLARLRADNSQFTTAIACDEYTAYCIDSNRNAFVFGEYPLYDDIAYVIKDRCSLNEVGETFICSPNTPFSFYDASQTSGGYLVYEIKGTPQGTFIPASENILMQDVNTIIPSINMDFWYFVNGQLQVDNSGENGYPCSLSTNDNEFNVNKTILYPNPTNGLIYIDNYPVDFPLAVEVYNLTGEKMFYAKNTVKLDISHFTNGIYLIKVINPLSTSLYRIVKQ